jgi:mannose-binding lectin
MALYAQTSGRHSTTSDSYVPIPGLTITIPQGVGTSALIILNLPYAYAEGPDFPGGIFGIAINGAVSTVVGGFTTSTQTVPNTGRVPTTLVLNVPLAGAVQTITALWRGVRGSEVIIDSPATLTGILD